MKTYGRYNDETVGSFALTKGNSDFLLETEHDQRQGEDERLARARERNADHVATGQPETGKRHWGVLLLKRLLCAYIAEKYCVGFISRTLTKVVL